jgi:hypothetical protein
MADDNLSHLKTRALLLLQQGIANHIALSPDEISRLRRITSAPREQDSKFLGQFDQYLADEEGEDRDDEAYLARQKMWKED